MVRDESRHSEETERILVHLAGAFYVQWPELVERYGKKAAYAGSLVDATPPGSLHSPQ